MLSIFRLKIVLFLLFFLSPMALFSVEQYTRTQALMGTFVHITLSVEHNKKISELFRKISVLESLLSSYPPYLVHRLNQKHKIPYNQTLSNAIQLSQQYYDDSDGYFDITIGSISKKIYHFGEEHSRLPHKGEVEKAILNIEGIQINDKTIETDANITIDLGGMGKGFTVDRVVDNLIEDNISEGVIALSGDIRCLDICTFQLQSPFSEERTFAQLTAKIPQLSISTSGIYRRYVKNKMHHHLINPKVGKPGKSFVSVSLFTQADNSKIDAYATAISVMPKEKALLFLEKHQDIGFILVDNSAKIFYGNLEKFVRLRWLDYKEKTNMERSNKKSKTNRAMEINLIHPDTTNPQMIKR